MEQPSGTVTFLFTDIERSTEIVGAIGNMPWADLLDRCRGLLRDAFYSHGGYEVATEGDSFFVVFATASDATRAALEAQRAIAAFSWPSEAELRVRMGLHTGEVLLRSGGYVGFDVHKAKRICDAGHGGQILLSQTTADLIGQSFALKDLGPHRLKDLAEPQRIHQLLDDVLGGDFPPLRSLESFRHNLPFQRSSFIGREREMTQVLALLSDHGVVTLTGVGGSGKTRLALQVGAESLSNFPDGVFFVDLAPITDAALIIVTIANAIEFPLGGELARAGSGGSVDELLLRFLAHRRCLLILDNCEHLLDGCAEVAARILAGCPDISLLATTREALGIDGEQTWRIPSLTLPEGGEVLGSEAVDLFNARAKAVRPDFQLTPQNAEAVAEICRRLDGIPLALEFAAARVAHLPPKEIAERLNDMFRLLTGGRRRVQRQQTLEATLDWSYELLSEPDRILLRRLSVFTGSFAISAVEGICAGDGVEAAGVLDLLGSLVAKSLVLTEDLDGAARYRLLETVRVYASEKLREENEADTIRIRYRDWYLAWLESLTWEQLYLSDAVRRNLEREHANLRAALEWSEAEGRMDLVARIAARLFVLWSEEGTNEEGNAWVSKINLEELNLDKEVRIACFDVMSAFENRFSSSTGGSFGDRSVEEAGGTPSSPLINALVGRAINRAIRAEWTRDPAMAAAARRDNDDAMSTAEELGVADAWRSHVLIRRGGIELLLGDFTAAAAALAAGIDSDPDPYPGFRLDLAAAAHLTGDHARALKEARLCLAASGRWRGAFASRLASVAIAIAGSGDLPAAETILRDQLEEVRRMSMPGGLEELIAGFAALAFMAGDPPRASRLLAWVRSRTFDVGQILPSNSSYALYRHYLRRVREALSPDDARRYRDEGRAMSENEAIACALQIEG